MPRRRRFQESPRDDDGGGGGDGDAVEEEVVGKDSDDAPRRMSNGSGARGGRDSAAPKLLVLVLAPVKPPLKLPQRPRVTLSRMGDAAAAACLDAAVDGWCKDDDGGRRRVAPAAEVRARMTEPARLEGASDDVVRSAARKSINSTKHPSPSRRGGGKGQGGGTGMMWGERARICAFWIDGGFIALECAQQQLLYRRATSTSI